MKVVTLREILQKQGKKSGDIVSARINGRPVDLNTPLNNDSAIEWITVSSPEGLDILRHSTSHLMAQAVRELYPDVKITIGPAIEDGFYYDFDYSRPFTQDDLTKIENKMKEIIKNDIPIIRMEMPREEAIRLFDSMGETYKVEIIKEITEEPVSLYKQGDFIDLCRGPHLPSTGKIRSFKLLNTAGAYWRGNEKNKMLHRIYGTAFPTQDDLDAYLIRLEEIKKRDHRKLGKELDLFSIQDEIGAGLILWHPKGAIIRKVIEDFWREEHLRHEYKLLYTPHVAKLDLWKTSGHTEFYQGNMYSPIEVEGQDFQLKPMNCPFHISIYKTKMHSYRDLPIRWAELGTVYRYERSGVLHGLLRVRGFTQDDAHIFCRPDQLEGEISSILDFTVDILSIFGFDKYDIYLSTRPDKFVGSIENWERATSALGNALKQKGLSYQIDPGEGVFYGPKIDIKIKDVLDRAWQCTTIQVDFNLPERFSITYAGEDGLQHQPIMIHRALMGSLERFFGILIEHYAGAFPLWLSPVQVKVLPITEKQTMYAEEVVSLLRNEGLRAELDSRNEKIGYKIREAQMEKVPFMFIIGGKEEESRSVSVRLRKEGDTGTMPLASALARIKEALTKRI
ncbi:MAG: threonine--tRNA ligase [Nitrospirae bacterium RIFCSPLOWO2_02_42_7]|nr:MAG: threonine--tRNA ligase [Nitrospirae bacterium RIFCSPLOWO2_02_42_7]